MSRLLATTLPLVVLLLRASMASGLEIGDLRLVPFPKEIRLVPGEFRPGDGLRLEISIDDSATFERLLNEELARAHWPPAKVRKVTSRLPGFRLALGRGQVMLPSLPPGNSGEAYALSIRNHEIVCCGQEESGLFYGLQTLCQMVRANVRNKALPCLEIADWPSLHWRGFQDDMTRGPSSRLSTLQFEAGLAAGLKLNLMTYYMEYQFVFRKHPLIGPTNGSLTPAELTALVKFAKPLNVEILGNQQSFGHFSAILQKAAYTNLQETPHVLSPAREETYRLLDDFYSEVCPLLPFPWFNVCCDETEGLGTGSSRALASKIGVGGVYVSHLSRLHSLLRNRYGKRMMMWGDIILQHPDRLTEIPKDTIMLSWGYNALPSFEGQIIPFAKSGYQFFICPGVNNWSRILPDFGVAVTNIHNFVRDGASHGALGMINTDWEDDGEALNAVKWHADAWAAECAWNASKTAFDEFNRRVGAVLFGEPGDHFGQAIRLLSQTHRLPAMRGMFNARFWERDFAGGPATESRAAASNLLALVRPALDHLQTCRREAKCNQHILDVVTFGARRMELIGVRMLDGLNAAELYREACATPPDLEKLAAAQALVRKNRDAHQALATEFAALWSVENEPYALDWTLNRYTNSLAWYDALLEKLSAASSAAGAGQPLPPPKALGLETSSP